MEKKCCRKSCLCIDGCKLNLIAASLANVFSQHFTCEELDVLAVFFDVFADALATFSVTNVLCCSDQCQNNSKEDDTAEDIDDTLSII